MPDPLALCIEDLDATSRAEQYTQCVALVGRQPGLRLDEAGRVTWLGESLSGTAGAIACELWVSADDRLILYRPEGAVPVTVRRAGRSLEAPFAKPVILLDKDEVDIGTQHFRLHIHGKAPAITAPKPLKAPGSSLGRLAKGAAAAAALMSAATGCIEVRTEPPVIAPPTETPTIDVRMDPPEITADVPRETPTIEVTMTPPTATPAPTPAPEGSVGRTFQEPWTFTQAYDVDGEQMWITGSLRIAGDIYWAYLTPDTERPKAPGALDFLLDHPSGEVVLTYAEGVTADAARADFAPGTPLATVDFYADGSSTGSLVVRAGEDSPYFTDSTDDNTMWNITQ